MSLASPLQFFLAPQPDTTIFTATVSATPAGPYTSISYSSGVVGSFGASIPGQTVYFGTSASGKERGALRLRNSPGAGSGTIEVAESDDVGPIIQSGDNITIKHSFRLWPKYPRFVQNGTLVQIFEDFDESFTNQTNLWRPVANAGPIGVGFLEGGQAQINFVGDRSFALAPGASLSSYLWTAYDSAESTSTSQGTEASPVTFTWTAPGWHLVSLRVTDSNGQTHTNYTWVVIIDPASPTDVAFVDFDTTSDSFDFEQGGGECAFTVRGDASVSSFPEEGLIVHVARGDITTPTGSWPFRTNVLFSGWILSNTVRQNPDTSEVSFRAGTVDAVMRNTKMFAVSLTDKNTPVEWTQGKSLTVDRVASFLWHHRSTLSLMTPIIPTNYTGLIRRQDFGPSKLLPQLQSQLMASIWGKVVSTPQGVLYHLIDYNVQNASERAGVTTRKALHKGIWVDDVTIEERADYAQPVSQVKMSGVFYPGGEIDDICPLFSEAPGDAPKVFGDEVSVDRLILLSQSDLNVRCGHKLAQLTQRYGPYRMRFINDGAFTTAPQELFPANIEASDNDRGLSFSGNLIPRRINRTYNHEQGFFAVDVDFEPETSGRAGDTVDMPCGPPEQELAGNPEPPAGVGGPSALMAGTTGTSYYYAPGLAQSWERRVTGLVDPDQLAFEALIPDPWSTFKQGYSPEKVIIWGGGKGFLVRSTDSGKNWQDRSGYLSDPAWAGETGTAFDDTTIVALSGDIFSEDRLFALARWQYTGAYHGAIARTENGFDYDWYNLTGSAQVRPLGLSLDRGDGSKLYVTTWETDAIYLRVLNVDDMTQAGRFSLGAATEGQIDAKTYFATPFNQLGAAGEVFAYGRMQNPQGLVDPAHIIKNTDCGNTGSYSAVESGWGDDLCGSFGADEDGNQYAVRNG